MKEITAYGQPFALLKIIDALRKLSLQPSSIHVVEVLDFSGRLGLPPVGEFVKKWKLEVLAERSNYEAIVGLICEVLRNEGRHGPQITIAEVESGLNCEEVQK